MDGIFESARTRKELQQFKRVSAAVAEVLSVSRNVKLLFSVDTHTSRAHAIVHISGGFYDERGKKMKCSKLENLTNFNSVNYG